MLDNWLLGNDWRCGGLKLGNNRLNWLLNNCLLWDDGSFKILDCWF